MLPGSDKEHTQPAVSNNDPSKDQEHKNEEGISYPMVWFSSKGKQIEAPTNWYADSTGLLART